MTDLKEIIELLPKIRGGRELTLQHDKVNHYWYVGYPNLGGDFSIDLHAVDRDIEGAALHLLSLIGKEGTE